MKFSIVFFVFSANFATASPLVEAAKACFDPAKLQTDKTQAQWLPGICSSGALISVSGPKSTLIALLDNTKGMPRVYNFELPKGALKAGAKIQLDSGELSASCGRTVRFSVDASQPLQLTLAKDGGTKVKSVSADPKQTAGWMANDIAQILLAGVARDPHPYSNINMRTCYSWFTAILQNYHLTQNMDAETMRKITDSLRPGKLAEPAANSGN